nr:hypothetical protein [Ardenticatena sp.]
MQYLHECPRGVLLKDRQSGQKIRLDVPDGWACCFYRFDAQQHFMPGDKSPDGVLLVRTPQGRTHVCFVEMKIRAKDCWSEAREQLERGITHFAPLMHDSKVGLLSHGDLHHARWRENEDILDVMPENTHSVWGLFLVKRRSGRSPSFAPGRETVFCGKSVRFASVLVPEREIDLETLLQRATIPL